MADYVKGKRMEELTMIEAAKRVGVSERTIRRAIKTSKLKADVTSNPKRAKINPADLDAWRSATQPIQATLYEELINELAALRQQVEAHTRAITELQRKQQEAPRTTTTTVIAPARPAQPKPKTVAKTTTELPEGWIWLYDFADLHHVSRNEAQGLWQRGNIKGKKIGEGRKARVAIDLQGQRDAWAQFKILASFGRCDHCPHSLPVEV